MRRRLAVGMIAGLGMLLTIRAFSAPAVDYLFPDGAQRGTTIHLTAAGKFDIWPALIWVDSPGIHFTCAKDKGEFTVQCDKDAPIGPHLVRFFTADGTSFPRVFMVGGDPEILEVEPNDTPRNAQHISNLPVTINGKLQQYDDTDCFAVKLSAGQRLIANLQCRRLGAGLDPMLHVLDEAGYELAFAHDGLGLDPLLQFTAPRAGIFIVRVSGFHDPPDENTRLAGDPSDIYRLHLTTGPFITHVLPAGVQRGQQATLTALGWNMPAGQTDFPIDARSVAAVWDHLMAPTPSGEMLRVEVGDGPELLASQVAGKSISAPAYINGCLEKIGQQDSFEIAAHKGEAFHFSATATVMGSALDPLIRIETAKDQLQAVGDWTAPEEKTYRLVISDQYHKGGDDYCYRLRIEHPKPAIQANPNAAAYVVGPGKTIDVTMTGIRLTGHATPLVAIASDLPPGIIATSAQLPPAGGAVVLKLSAATDAKPFNGLIHLFFVGVDPLRPEVDPAVFNLSTEKDITQQMIYLCDPWLTVLPPPPPATTQAATQPAAKPK